MSESGYPVTVGVRRPDGSMEQVRVGTAYRSGEGFRLEMGELAIGGEADAAPGGGSASSAGASAGSGAGSQGGEVTHFPNYGRSKNGPIAGASEQDLEYYAN